MAEGRSDDRASTPTSRLFFHSQSNSRRLIDKALSTESARFLLTIIRAEAGCDLLAHVTMTKWSAHSDAQTGLTRNNRTFGLPNSKGHSGRLLGDGAVACRLAVAGR
jgi:hypothetical protein